MKKYLLIFNTVKYLRPCQISGQIRNRLRNRFENPSRLLSRPVPDIGKCRWPADIEILPPGMQLNSAEDILAGKMTFLNSTQEVGWMPDWQSEELPKLWLYNLHYFEWLWALDYEDAKAVTLDWISHHEPAKGRQGWEPYPISLRLMTLCGVFFSKFKSEVEEDATFVVELWERIYRQCQWLMSHLETHILGNHYLENGAALAFVGSCFEGDAAFQWLERGLSILREQIPEQILPDGMHFELSPMYHSRMLYLMAILSATGNKQLTELVDEPMQRMAHALAGLCHPDGQIALFNDSAFGIYNHPAQLVEYCDRVGGLSRQDACDTGVPPAASRPRGRPSEATLPRPTRLTGQDGGDTVVPPAASGQQGRQDACGTVVPPAASGQQGRQDACDTVVPPASSGLSEGAFSLPDAGYYGWRDDKGHYLICDFGKIGPDYQPGHAHADFGCYELSLNGHRVIVDSGAHDYEPSDHRRYSRSTAAHNTVEISGTDQCELWGTFRIARRGYPQDVHFKANETGMDVSGSHSGYERLPGRPRHKRSIRWDNQAATLTVGDQVLSGKPVRSVSRIHLHPDCSIKNQTDRLFEIIYPAGLFQIRVQGACKISVGTGWYFPEFGKKVQNAVIEIQTEDLNCEIKYMVKSIAE